MIKLGFSLLGLSVGIYIAYISYHLLRVLFFGPIPIFFKIAASGFIGGFLILLCSVVLDRIRERKTDIYEDDDEVNN